MNLNSTVALVTGGARRVGRAIVLELADAGCDIALHYHRSADEARSVAAKVAERGRRCTLIQADLAETDAPRRIIREAIEGAGRLDVLVNNAALFDTMRIEDFDLARWERTLRVNLAAPAALCHFARPHLEAGGGGKIVNLCDIVAERPGSGHLAYCMSKAGLVSLTRALAKALAPKIQVNGVAPGIAVFPDQYDAVLREKLIARVPLGRAGTPEDVARTVRFLVEGGDYITGQIITVDGGRSTV